MAKKNSNKESEKATLGRVEEEMAKPRIAKSARIAEPEMLHIFTLSESKWPGLARPIRRSHRLI